MHIEDINVGECITPLDGKANDLAASPFSFFVTERTPDNRGVIYQVLALDLPFAVVRQGKQRGVLDLRDHVWKRLSPEFVAAAFQKQDTV